MKPIFIDVDGTLRNSQHEITQPTQDALNLAKQKGFEPIVCTGRSRNYILESCKQLHSNYLVYNNGAGIYDCLGKKTLFEKSIPASSIIDLYDIVKSTNIGFSLAYDGSDHQYRLGNHPKDYDELSSNLLHEILEHHQITQINVYSIDYESMRSLGPKIHQISQLKIANQSKKLADPTITHTSFSYFYDIVNADTTKGAAIREFCKIFNIPTASCIAIGDGENDISMFQVCGFSVAMNNALAKVKAAANYITLDNDNDGVAYFIQQKLLA